MTAANVLPYGPHAALIECQSGLAVRLGQALLHTGRFVEVVPAEQSVLVLMPRGMVVEDVHSIVAALPQDLPQAEGRHIAIPVVYDGPDLTLVAEATGLSVADVIALHSQTEYFAAFSGFAPGYTYCTGLDRQLWLARRPSPRTSVPAGSVAIADAYTAVYPQSSPGGWHLIGRTDLTLFDLTRAEPALIRPGDRVRFTVRTP